MSENNFTRVVFYGTNKQPCIQHYSGSKIVQNVIDEILTSGKMVEINLVSDPKFDSSVDKMIESMKDKFPISPGVDFISPVIPIEDETIVTSYIGSIRVNKVNIVPSMKDEKIDVKSTIVKGFTHIIKLKPDMVYLFSPSREIPTRLRELEIILGVNETSYKYQFPTLDEIEREKIRTAVIGTSTHDGSRTMREGKWLLTQKRKGKKF